MPTETTSALDVNYLLKRIDPDLWAAFNLRARREGVTMRSVILQCVRAYVDGRIDLVANPATPATPTKRATAKGGTR